MGLFSDEWDYLTDPAVILSVTPETAEKIINDACVYYIGKKIPAVSRSKPLKCYLYVRYGTLLYEDFIWKKDAAAPTKCIKLGSRKVKNERQRVSNTLNGKVIGYFICRSPQPESLRVDERVIFKKPRELFNYQHTANTNFCVRVDTGYNSFCERCCRYWDGDWGSCGAGSPKYSYAITKPPRPYTFVRGEKDDD